MTRGVPWALLVAAALSGCAADDDGDTLQPLPVEGNTAAPVTSPPTTAGPSLGPPVPATGSIAPSTSTTTTVAGTTTTTTTVAAAPVGDWDGARFDAGTIAAVTQLGGADAISFDRYSYTAEGLGTVDAGGMRSEPIAAWWRLSPFSNVRVQLRTFVLAPDVEVLTLDESDRTAACADPPPPSPPAPAWEDADISALEGPAVAGSIATLTYSATGQVTRVRLTHGC